MNFNRSKDSGPTWCDPDNLPEDSPRFKEIEDHIAARAKRKRLEDCELPAGFRLVNAQPKQYWIGNQLVWAFCIAWAPADIQGRRWCEDRYHFIARYDWRVADEAQIRWALEEFSTELTDAGVQLGAIRDFLPTPQFTNVRNIKYSRSHRNVAA